MAIKKGIQRLFNEGYLMIGAGSKALLLGVTAKEPPVTTIILALNNNLKDYLYRRR